MKLKKQFTKNNAIFFHPDGVIDLVNATEKELKKIWDMGGTENLFEIKEIKKSKTK